MIFQEEMLMETNNALRRKVATTNSMFGYDSKYQDVTKLDNFTLNLNSKHNLYV